MEVLSLGASFGSLLPLFSVNQVLWYITCCFIPDAKTNGL